MSDDTGMESAVDAAIETVAAWVAAWAVRVVEHANYSEIGEADWARIVERMADIVPVPKVSLDGYEAAYELLTARAES